MDTIQMVDLRKQYLQIKPKIDSAIQEVIDSTAFVKGPAEKKFAANLASYLNVKHVIPCANGTDALQIALMALGLQPGDEVITPTFTYIATVEVVALLGLKPVFVEVDEHTFTMQPEALEKAITAKTKAIVPVHLYGLCSHMEPILNIANKHGIPVIEDNAQAIGSVYTFSNGTQKMTASMGTIACFSFYPTKNLGCYGDGGAMATNDDQLAETLRMIANHGQKQTYYFDKVGCNSRLDSIQAAILDTKLTMLDSYNAKRNEAANYYDSKLKSLSMIKLPTRASYATHVFHQYTICVPRRDELKAYLQEQGIPSMIYYPKPAHLQVAYQQYGYKEGDFPLSERLCNEVISLPMHSELTKDQQDFITSHVIKFYNQVAN